MKIIRTLFLCSILTLTTFSLISQDAPTAASLYNEGLAKAKAKEYITAFELMQKAVAAAEAEDNEEVLGLAKKTGTRAAYGAGIAYKKKKDMANALKAFETGIEYNPSYYTNYSGKAGVLEAEGKKAEAITAYLEASDVAAKVSKAEKATQYQKKAANIVAVAEGKKQWTEAKQYSEAYLAHSQHANVNYCLASSMKELGDAAGAVAFVDKAIAEAAEGKKSKYYFLKGQIHEKLGQKSDAIAAYRKVTGATYSAQAKYKVTELGG